ncbi:MAG TPA: hypothetical protein VFG81_18550 [Anaerolineales bacterium]|nr:hypothetical protein [Anaerolineales bacterium]
MKRSLALVSLVLFGVSALLLLVWTASESAFLGMTAVAERIVAFVMLVVPAGLGAVFGVMSLIRKEGQKGLAIAGVLLNTLFAGFHLLVVLFAG